MDPLPERRQMTRQCTQTLPTEDDWWKTFNDSTLDALIAKAVANNYDVAAALRRIEMADKIVKEAQSGYFPTLSLSGSWTKGQQSGAVSDPVGRYERRLIFLPRRDDELGNRCVRKSEGGSQVKESGVSGK